MKAYTASDRNGDEDIRDSLVVTTLLSEDEVIMVGQDEFLQWLREEPEEERKME